MNNIFYIDKKNAAYFNILPEKGIPSYSIAKQRTSPLYYENILLIDAYAKKELCK